MTTTYQSSKGEVEISTMPLSYAKNAVNKLRRTEPERTAEIAALQAHVDALEAAATAKALDAAGEGKTGFDKFEARAAVLNERAVIGGNNPPPDEGVTENVTLGWEAVQTHMDDLLVEAANWADGIAIASQDQADTVGRLRQQLQDVAQLADKARVAEKKPLDDQIAAIQDRYNAYIAPMKNKQPGSVSKAVTALGNLLTAWLNKLADEKKAREDAAREEAEKAAAAAIAARKEMDISTDLAAADEAAALLDIAEEAAKTLRAVEREKVQVQGEYRAIGQRTVWSAEITDRKAALLHYLKAQPDEFVALIQTLADRDARNEATRRDIPGVRFIDQKVAA